MTSPANFVVQSRVVQAYDTPIKIIAWIHTMVRGSLLGALAIVPLLWYSFLRLLEVTTFITGFFWSIFTKSYRFSLRTIKLPFTIISSVYPHLKILILMMSATLIVSLGVGLFMGLLGYYLGLWGRRTRK